MLSLEGGTDEQACEPDNLTYVCHVCASKRLKVRVDFFFFNASWTWDSCGWLSACRCLRKLFLDWVDSASRCWMVHGWDNTCWKDTCNQILIHSCTTHAELMCSCGTNPSTPCSSQLILTEVSHFKKDEMCNCFKPHDYDVSVILAHNVSSSSATLYSVAWETHTRIWRERKRAMVTWECVSVPVSHSVPKLQQINILLLLCHSWELAHCAVKTGSN